MVLLNIISSEAFEVTRGGTTIVADLGGSSNDSNENIED